VTDKDMRRQHPIVQVPLMRKSTPRNSLFLSMIALAELIDCKIIRVILKKQQKLISTHGKNGKQHFVGEIKKYG
jgi:hypothetical protein